MLAVACKDLNHICQPFSPPASERLAERWREVSGIEEAVEKMMSEDHAHLTDVPIMKHYLGEH